MNTNLANPLWFRNTNPAEIKDKIAEMQETITGYWKNDVWDLKGDFFKNELGFNHNGNYRHVNFKDFNRSVALEIKFWFIKSYKTDLITLGTLTSYCSRLTRIRLFLEKFFPGIQSLAQIDLDKGCIQWVTYLTNEGTSVTPDYKALFNNLISFIHDFFDDRDEFDKDIWDLRKIPNTKLTKNTSSYLLNFTDIPQKFRHLVRNYIKSQVTTRSQANLSGKIRGLERFLDYIVKNKPDWRNFNALSRRDYEEYLNYFNLTFGHRSNSLKTQYLIPVHDLMLYLQIGEYNEAPKRPVAAIFLQGDMPRNIQSKKSIKWIPENVLNQLRNVLETEPSILSPLMREAHRKYVPVVLLLIASGWRISDVLNLRYDNCLVCIKDGWYLQGDITKTEVIDHRIPIDLATAKLVQAVVQSTKEISTPDNNPDKYLFPTTSGKRKGLMFTGKKIRDVLNLWASEYKITDDDGEIFHFKNHAFRHTKGMELINSGMNILHVQKWLAHASPEMTLVYASITDQTLRNEWLQAQENANFYKIDINTGVVNPLSDEDLLEWEYIKSNIEAAKVPLGYCMAAKKMSCPYVETPCLNCNNFCTTPENLPEFEAEIASLEALIEVTKDMPIWNEKNQKRHNNLLDIRNKLVQGKIHHPAGKKAREVSVQ